MVQWLNVADLDDIVAAEPNLHPLFTHDMPDSSDFTGLLVGNGSKPHNPIHYLGKIAVGQAIIKALA